MPRAKLLANYDNAQYGRLYAGVSRTGKKALINLPRLEAVSLRAELYAWARVARASPEQAKELGIDLRTLEDVRLKVTDAGLLAFHKEDGLGSSALKEAIAALGPIPEGEPEPEPVAPEPKIDIPGMSEEDMEALFNPEVMKKKLGLVE